MATKGQIAEQNMSTADQAALKAAGDRYNAAKAAGDTAAMEAAHKDAENIRAGYGYSGGTNGAGYTELPKQPAPTTGGSGGSGGGGGNTPTTTPTQQSYYIRDGQRVSTNFVNGHNVNADGTAIQWKPGDISVTPSGQYYIIGDNGQARQIVSSNTNDTLALMNALGRSDGYTPKGSDLQIGIQQGFEDWLKANDPNGWSTYLGMALEWNAANTRGDTAAAAQLHKQMENFRNQYGHVGGSDGTLTRVTNPDNIPPELVELFQPLIDEYNQELAIEGMAPISMNEFISLMNIGQYPEYIKAVIAQAPTSKLALQLSAMFPEYTVGEGVEKMEGLGYDPKYMPQYWNDFTNTYDYEKYAPEYDAIRDQLIAANQAGVDLGRMQLEAQLQNALPEYDELRRQNALAQAKAANNTALYNQAQGDLGGIGSRRYSLEQNAYDQRMNEIQLEQQNLINTTNQQIAQLEAEGKMKEAQLLAEWGQAKLEAMQEQYNLYWNMYQQGASAMENLEYGIASDEWDRLYKLRQDELNEQLNKYKADVDAYNAAVQKAQMQLAVDESNRDYDYSRWKDLSNIALQQAQLENAYNADKYNAAVDQQKLQLAVDESNRDYAYQKYLDDRNFNYQLGRDKVSDTRYDQEWAEQLKEVAFDNAMKKLSMGMVSDTDIAALGVPASQAKDIASRINILAQLDVDMARAELAHLQKQTSLLGASRSGSGGSGGSGGGGGGGGSLPAVLNPETAGAYNPVTGNYQYTGNAKGATNTVLDMLGIWNGQNNGGQVSSDNIINPHDSDQVQVADYGVVPYGRLSELVAEGVIQQIETPNGLYYIRVKGMSEGR